MAKVVYTNLEVLVTGVVILICFVAVSFFPTQGLFQNLIGMATFLIIMPFLYVKFILKKSLREFGFQVGDWRKGFWGLFLALIFSAPVIYILINYTDLLQKQSALKIMQGRFADFLYYEAVFSASLVVMFEIFFRGFILLGTAKKLGWWSIGLQLLLTPLLIWIIGFSSLGSAYYLVFGSFIAGIIAYRSQSLLYGLIFNAFFFLIADAVVIKLLK